MLHHYIAREHERVFGKDLACSVRLRPLPCPRCLLLSDRGFLCCARGILPGECNLLSSGSSMSFGTGDALSLDISVCRRRIGKSSSGCILLIHLSREVPSRKEGSAFQIMRCSAWDTSHKHQGYPPCYGIALARQQDLYSPTPVTFPYSVAVPVLQQKREIFLASRTESVAQKGSGRFCSLSRSILSGTSYAEHREQSVKKRVK